jgi:uncharacterized membrane protein
MVHFYLAEPWRRAFTVILLMPSIRDEWDYVERTFTCMMSEFQLVWFMHVRITIVLVKLVFFVVSNFQNSTKAAIKFCVKLKKTATET